MKTLLLSTILAAGTPWAIAQQAANAPAVAQHGANTPAETLSEKQQDRMAGPAVEAPLPRALENLVMSDAFEQELGGELHPSVIKGARRAYAQTIFEPIWTERGAASLKDATQDLFSYGLAPDEVLEDDLRRLTEQRFESSDPEARARADIGLTSAWLRIAAAISGGLADEGQMESSDQDEANYALLPEQLQEAGKGGAADALKAFEPANLQYRELKKALQIYREIRDDGGWLAIPEGDVIEVGDTDKRVPAIRERLAKEGYEADQPAETQMTEITFETPDGEPAPEVSDDEKGTNPKITYDEALSDAVKDFQLAHGITTDGIFGPETRRALNESVDSKLARIADTMERWRKLAPLEDAYVWVNIPAYRAEGWRDNRREISVKTIVGTSRNETPTFNDTIEYAIANPRWYVPVSITRNEQRPKLQNDPGYASRGNFKVYDRATGEEVSPWEVNWNDPSSASKYRLVQMSGESNALGELKIIFPNQYSIYMHDTPSEHLFDRAERAFSHGCVRLEQPTKMAEWVAKLDPQTNPREIDAALEDNDREKIPFQREIPIHITYMTVTVDEDGDINFWRDIYDRTEGIERVKQYAPLYQAENSAQSTETERG